MLSNLDFQPYSPTTNLMELKSTPSKKFPEIDNLDPNVCIAVAAGDQMIILKHVDLQSNSNMSMMIRVVVERDPTCGDYNQHEFFPMMKMHQPFGALASGTFSKCDLMLDETILNDYVFNCTCNMLYCYEVYFRVQPTCPLRVCSINIF